MKKFAIIAIAALVSASAFAQSEIGNSYVFVKANGAENGVWYRASGVSDWDGAAANAFNGYDLGSLTSLTLGGQLSIYANNAYEWTGFSLDAMGYKVTQGSGENKTTVIDSTTLNMTYLDNGNDENKGNYLRAQTSLADTVDISGLADGTYNLEVWFGSNGLNDKWDSNNNANYVATFTKGAASSVPEPATMSLLGLGALAMVIRRKLSK